MTENIITIKKGAGKGDARRDNLTAFQRELAKISMKGRKTSGTVVLDTETRTRIVYK
jgi:hypothetical protein